MLPPVRISCLHVYQHPFRACNSCFTQGPDTRCWPIAPFKDGAPVPDLCLGHVVSDGSAKKPGCYWDPRENATAAQAACAKDLCQAAGCGGGTYLSGENLLEPVHLITLFAGTFLLRDVINATVACKPLLMPSPAEFLDMAVFDLTNTLLRFTPGASSPCLLPSGSMTTDAVASSARPLSLGDDSFEEISFQAFSFPFGGDSYNSVFVGSNGHIDFGNSSGAATYNSESHYIHPRVSALMTDLVQEPGISNVTWAELADRVVISYADMVFYGASTTRASFEVVLHSDGEVTLVYGDVSRMEGIKAAVGISYGELSAQEEVDLSAARQCQRA